MKRREFFTLVGGAAVAWPLAAGGQQGERMRRVGVLTNLPSDDPEGMARLAAFLQGLQQLGWTDGQNVRIDVRAAASDVERMRKFAAELVALAPDVILVNGITSRRTTRVRPSSCRSPTPWAAAWSRAWRGRVATPLASPCSNTAAANMAGAA
jgi:putative ABC transport system substrate-binding protein